MSISRELFNEIKATMGAHTSWAVRAPAGENPGPPLLWAPRFLTILAGAQ